MLLLSVVQRNFRIIHLKDDDDDDCDDDDGDGDGDYDDDDKDDDEHFSTFLVF